MLVSVTERTRSLQSIGSNLQDSVQFLIESMVLTTGLIDLACLSGVNSLITTPQQPP